MMMMNVSARKAIVYCALAFVYTTYCCRTPTSGISPDTPPLFHLRYRFAEIYYRRGESSHKGRSSTTARVETTVLFLPDVWNVCPAKLEWDGLHLNYKHQLEKKLSCSTGATPQLDEQEGEEEENKALIRPFSSLRFYSLLADHLPVLPPSSLLQSQLAYFASSVTGVVFGGVNLVAARETGGEREQSKAWSLPPNTPHPPHC